ncbi:MAG: patatin-like phospholipase RssA [Gammaproteobacteria bacterium]|nr:patatin-like phospholipase RssA [Gammaproteobacteria bacterium]
MDCTDKKPKIGLALGSGSARGWSHIGVIQELEKADIVPDIVCGSSIGSIVAAAYANNRLQHLEQGIQQLSPWNMLKFFELSINTRGFIDNKRLNSFIEEYVCNADQLIENLPKKFSTVATELRTGREIWFEQGPIIDSIWASFALPGLFSPVNYRGKWLVDGGLVNPVPISLCRALGADLVIAVNLNGDLVGHRSQMQNHSLEAATTDTPKTESTVMDALSLLVKKTSSSLLSFDYENNTEAPSLLENMASSINITQDFITRSRMAGDPPDVMLSPRLANIGLLEFDRGHEAIEEGRNCVKRLLPEIEYLINLQ